MASWWDSLYQIRELPLIVAFITELFESGRNFLYGCLVELPVRLFFLSSGPDASTAGFVGTGLFYIALTIWIRRKINHAVESSVFGRTALWVFCGLPAEVLVPPMIWGLTFSMLASLWPILVNWSQFYAGLYSVWILYRPVDWNWNMGLYLQASTYKLDELGLHQQTARIDLFKFPQNRRQW